MSATVSSERIRRVRSLARSLNDTNANVRARQPIEEAPEARVVREAEALAARLDAPPAIPVTPAVVATPVVRPVAPPPAVAPAPRPSLLGPILQILGGGALAALALLATGASALMAAEKGAATFESYEKAIVGGLVIAAFGVVRLIARLLRR